MFFTNSPFNQHLDFKQKGDRKTNVKHICYFFYSKFAHFAAY